MVKFGIFWDIRKTFTNSKKQFGIHVVKVLKDKRSNESIAMGWSTQKPTQKFESEKPDGGGGGNVG